MDHNEAKKILRLTKLETRVWKDFYAAIKRMDQMRALRHARRIELVFSQELRLLGRNVSSASA
jgi:hypothetical protein